MLSTLIYGLMAILLAFAYRARGGAIPLGEDRTQLARILFWGVPMTVCFTYAAWDLNCPLYLGLICGIMSVLSMMLGHSFAAGGTIVNFLEEALIGFARLGLVLLPFIVINPILFCYTTPLGISQFIAGFLGYRIFANKTLTVLGINWCRPVAEGGSEWEELFTGFFPYGIALLTIGICHYIGVF